MTDSINYNRPDDEQPLILAVDTSSLRTSIAVALGERVIASADHEKDDSRSDTLWAQVGSILEQASIGPADVDLYAVCVGPGSFTGIRVGLAAIKGFAMATVKPVAAVTSLEAIALAAGPAPLVLALVPAYKGEVYSQLFAFDQEGYPLAQEPAVVTSLAEALESHAHLDDVMVAGDVEATAGRVIKKIGGVRALYFARSGYRKFLRGELESAESLKAFYIRSSEAEIKLSQGLLGSKIRRTLAKD